jgi:hypothetical protein
MRDLGNNRRKQLSAAVLILESGAGRVLRTRLLLATEELSGDQDRCRQPVSRLAAAWPNLGPWCWNRPMTFGCRRSLPGQYVSIFVHLPDSDRQPRQYTVSSTAVGRDSRSKAKVGDILGQDHAPRQIGHQLDNFNSDAGYEHLAFAAEMSRATMRGDLTSTFFGRAWLIINPLLLAAVY